MQILCQLCIDDENSIEIKENALTFIIKLLISCHPLVNTIKLKLDDVQDKKE